MAPWPSWEGVILLSSQPQGSILGPRKGHALYPQPLSCSHPGSSTVPAMSCSPFLPRATHARTSPEPVWSLLVPFSNGNQCSCVQPRPTGAESAVNDPDLSSLPSKLGQAISTGPADCPAQFARDLTKRTHTSSPHTFRLLQRR